MSAQEYRDKAWVAFWQGHDTEALYWIGCAKDAEERERGAGERER